MCILHVRYVRDIHKKIIKKQNLKYIECIFSFTKDLYILPCTKKHPHNEVPGTAT